MKYRPSEGIFGNIKRLFSEATKTNNTVWTNKANADQTQANNEDIFCSLDDIQRIADLEEAVLELEMMIEEKES